MTQTRSYKQFYSTFQIRIILVVPPNMEHPIHSTVFRWNKHPIRDIVSSPFYLFFPPPSPHYHLSFLPWYCLYVFLFSTYVFYFSPWNTHTHAHTHSRTSLSPCGRNNLDANSQRHTSNLFSRDESVPWRETRGSRKSNDISWICRSKPILITTNLRLIVTFDFRH